MSSLPLYALVALATVLPGCASQTARTGSLSLRDDAPRVTVRQARQLVRTQKALLVCAYADEERCVDMQVKGSLSLEALQRREPRLARSQVLLFFCA